MKQLSRTQLVIAGVSAVIAACSFFMACLAVSARESGGAWLFGAFGSFFSVLPLSVLTKLLATRSELFSRIDKKLSPEPETSRGVRFVPHWMMLLAMIMLALIILSLAITVIRSLF